MSRNIGRTAEKRGDWMIATPGQTAHRYQHYVLTYADREPYTYGYAYHAVCGMLCVPATPAYRKNIIPCALCTSSKPRPEQP